MGILVGVCVADATTLMLMLLGFFIARRRKKALCTKREKFSVEEQNHVPHMYTLKELSKAMKNFSRNMLLGCGGLGTLYIGTELPSDALVAVKRMRHEDHTRGGGFPSRSAVLAN